MNRVIRAARYSATTKRENAVRLCVLDHPDIPKNTRLLPLFTPIREMNLGGNTKAAACSVSKHVRASGPTMNEYFDWLQVVLVSDCFANARVVAPSAGAGHHQPHAPLR